MSAQQMIMNGAHDDASTRNHRDTGSTEVLVRLEFLYRSASNGCMSTSVLLDFLDGIEHLLRTNGRPQFGTPLSEEVSWSFALIEDDDDEPDFDELDDAATPAVEKNEGSGR